MLQFNRFADLAACQTAFDTWRRVYNEERPHDALDLAVPATRYRPSPRTFPDRLPDPDYAAGETVRRVSPDGYVSFRGTKHKMSQAFAGHEVAIRPTTLDGVWTISFGRFAVGRVDLTHGNALSQPVRDVSEHLSGMSPV